MTAAKKSKAPPVRAKRKKTAASAGSEAGRAKPNKVQGEGDYASAREFNNDERKFVETHDTDELGHGAAPHDSAEAAELDAAERKGKARARPDPEAGEGADDPDDEVERGRS